MLSRNLVLLLAKVNYDYGKCYLLSIYVKYLEEIRIVTGKINLSCMIT